MLMLISPRFYCCFVLLFNPSVSKTLSEILDLSKPNIFKEKIQHIIIFLSKVIQSAL